MIREGTESWRVGQNADQSLNFAVFVACAYGLFANEPSSHRGKYFPFGMISLPQPSVDELSILSSQWEQWWARLLEHRSQQIDQLRPKMLSRWFEPPVFIGLEFAELQSRCKEAWPFFNEWWSMPAGGEAALRWYRDRSSDQIHNWIRTVEGRKGREAKPFRLHIDLVYTGKVEVIEVSPEYVVVCNPILLLKKDWWLEKFEQIV